MTLTGSVSAGTSVGVKRGLREDFLLLSCKPWEAFFHAVPRVSQALRS